MIPIVLFARICGGRDYGSGGVDGELLELYAQSLIPVSEHFK